MAGLNFQTQTIINSNLDPDSGKELLSKGGDSDESYVKILRDFIFYKNKEGYGRVLSISKRPGYNFKKCEATIDFLALIKKLGNQTSRSYFRLDVYLGIEGAEPYIYSTPWVQKGMPFWIEFAVDPFTLNGGDSDATNKKTAKAIADDIAATIKKDHLFQCDKDLMEVKVDANGVMTLTGATEYQRFRKIVVSKYDELEDDSQVVATLGDTSKIVVLKQAGLNSFGTYSQIVKDLRLPTAANTQWSHIRKVETPIVGAIYDQYIINYCAPATNDGLQAVGQKMDSMTTHVFWIKHEVASAFDTAFATLGSITDNTNSKAA